MSSNQKSNPKLTHIQPNVVIMVADDLGWNDVSYHNAPFQTPAIDCIAAEGVELDRFYTPPICTPCRAALLTGRDPMRMGLSYSVLFPWHNFGAPPQEHFMSESFQQAGYQTAMIGKWHLGHTIPQHHPNRRGFDYYWGHLHSAIGYWEHAKAGGHDLQRNGRSINKDGQYATFLAGKEAVNWIKKRDKTRPFFLYVPFIAPHNPMEAPQDLIDKYSYIPEENNRRVFAAMVDAMDQAIGWILDTLDKEGIANDTIVLFFSDNGGMISQGADNTPLRGGKGQTFEGGIRVPAVMRWPTKLRGGRKIPQVISVMDIFPTLAAVTKVKPQNTKPMDGKNVWSAITSDNATDRDDDLCFISEIPIKDLTYTGVMRRDWKLVQIVDQLQTTTTVNTFLFNIKDDPYEENNLAEEQAEIVQDLAARIKEYRSMHPIAGARTHLVPHPGWRAPYDWAKAMKAYKGIINEAREDYWAGKDRYERDVVDQWYGERGRLLYK